MKNILSIAALFILALGTSFAQTKRTGKVIPPTPVVEPSKGAPEAAAKAAPVAGKSIKGDVVSVMTYCAKGKAPKLSKDEADMMAKRGEMLGVLSGKKLYLVVNADGTSAGSKLANGGTVTVSGKIMSKGGLNMITANSVQ